jgi:hypothetical protein
MKTLELIDLLCPFVVTFKYRSRGLASQSWSTGTALLKFKILFIYLALGQYSLVNRTQLSTKLKKQTNQDCIHLLRSKIQQAALDI